MRRVGIVLMISDRYFDLPSESLSLSVVDDSVVNG